MQSLSSNLDGIRAIAVTLVVASHAWLQVTGGADLPFYDIHTMGHIGVAIFFVHTTLVLMQSLERHGPAAMPFYIRRFFRIYPLSIAIVLFMALMLMIANKPIDGGKLVSNLLLAQNITGHQPAIHPLWSLPYEVQMYLVLPALFMITRLNRPAMWAGALCIGSAAVMLLLPAESFEYKLLRFIPCFVPGLLAFTLAARRVPSAGPYMLFGLLAFSILFIPMLVAAGLPEIPLLWCLCMSLGLTIPACRQIPDGAIARSTKVVAKYSYGIYISHALAIGAIDGLLPGPRILQWIAFLFLLWGLAYICYHGIEKRGIEFGASLADRWDSKRQNFSGAAKAD